MEADKIAAPVILKLLDTMSSSRYSFPQARGFVRFSCVHDFLMNF